jgi:hypothetical protein
LNLPEDSATRRRTQVSHLRLKLGSCRLNLPEDSATRRRTQVSYLRLKLGTLELSQLT